MTSTFIAYRVAPQMEFKAAEEVQRSGIPYRLLTETVTTRRTGNRKPTERTVPIMRCYLPAAGKPRDAKYIKSAVGPVPEAQLIRMSITMDRIQRRKAGQVVPYRVGQAGSIGDVPAVVADINGEEITVVWEMIGGKQHTQTMHYSRFRPG
jgi:hypothetical protein